MIYVTVGTHGSDFGRLISAMDAIAVDTKESVVIQTGLSTTLPETAEHFEFKPREEILELQREARVIVCHAGIGSVIDALKMKRPLICVPRLRRFGEHNNDHQLEIAEAVQDRGWGVAVFEISNLAAACANPPVVRGGYTSAREPLLAHLRDFVANSGK